MRLYVLIFIFFIIIDVKNCVEAERKCYSGIGSAIKITICSERSGGCHVRFNNITTELYAGCLPPAIQGKLLCSIEDPFDDIFCCCRGNLCNNRSFLNRCIRNSSQTKTRNSTDPYEEWNNSTRSPLRPTDRPWLETRRPWRATNRPWLETRRPWRATDRPRWGTRRPWRATDRPWWETRRPWRPTDRPWWETRRPWRPSGRPRWETRRRWKATDRPWWETRRPWRPSDRPWWETRTPWMHTDRPWWETKRPYPKLTLPGYMKRKIENFAYKMGENLKDLFVSLKYGEYKK